jgi:enamine deaminase RidA (YjgF/YER057c/UK114 family)
VAEGRNQYAPEHPRSDRPVQSHRQGWQLHQRWRNRSCRSGHGSTRRLGRPVVGQLVLDSFKVMLESVGSDLHHVVQVNIFLKQTSDFESMNAAYVDKMGDHRPARTVIGASELPKPGMLLNVNLTAVTNDR